MMNNLRICAWETIPGYTAIYSANRLALRHGRGGTNRARRDWRALNNQKLTGRRVVKCLPL